MSADIEGLSDDEGEVTLPSFFTDSVDSQPLPRVDWYAKEDTSIEERTSRVVRNSQLYLDSKKSRKVTPHRAEPPQVQSTPPSTSKRKPRKKQWCNPPRGMRMSKPRTQRTPVEKATHSLEIITGIAAPKQRVETATPDSAEVITEEPAVVVVEEPVVEPMAEATIVEAAAETVPVMEAELPISPVPHWSQVLIDLDSPPRDIAPAQSHTSSIQGPHVPPSEVRRDSIWLEGFLGRKSKKPSYELDFTEFDHVPQDTSAKRLNNQVHIERNAECEIIIETAAPPVEKSIHEVQVED